MKSAYGVRRVTASASLPVRGAWIEMRFARCEQSPEESLPVRGAWIEMVNPAD